MFNKIKELADKLDKYIEDREEEKLRKLRLKVNKAKSKEKRIDEEKELREELKRIEDKKKALTGSQEEKFKKLDEEYGKKLQ